MRSCLPLILLLLGATAFGHGLAGNVGLRIVCSVFFNKEAETSSSFEMTEHNCDSLKQLSLVVANKPTVIWGFYQGGDAQSTLLVTGNLTS